MLHVLNEKGIGAFINLEKWGLSSFVLKIIAVVTMAADRFSAIIIVFILSREESEESVFRFLRFCLWKDFFIPMTEENTESGWGFSP